MSITTLERKLTAEDLLAMGSEGERYELDEGELIEMSPAGPRHGQVSFRISYRLGQFLEQNNLGILMIGDVGFRLQDDLVRAPDVAFLGLERLREHPIPRRGFYPGAPDLAIEIRSPEDRAGELLRKVGAFLSAGTRLVWVLDPERETVTVYRESGEMDVLRAPASLSGEDVLPGFACPVAELFPPPSDP